MGGLFHGFEVGESVLTPRTSANPENQPDPGSPASGRIWVPPSDKGVRGRDSKGDGAFGARRTRRDGTEYAHEGVDYVVTPGDTVAAVTEGYISKFGNPYRDDDRYRYVEITTPDGYVVKHMYVDPHKSLKLNSHVYEGDPIGTAQSLQPKYPGITDHIHVEIEKNKAKIDPRTLIR